MIKFYNNVQVCNEEEGGVCCKKNYELTNGVVVKPLIIIIIKMIKMILLINITILTKTVILPTTR